MKELLTRMASIANELDLKGFVKEANEITNSMLKVSQQTPKDINQRASEFDANQIADFKRILKNNPGLTDAQYYLMAKGLYAKDQSTTNFANNFMAYKRDPSTYSSGGTFKDGGTFETKTGPSQLTQGPIKNPLNVNPLGNNDIFAPKPRKGLTSYPQS